jgi:hypothetical protein
MSQFKPIIVANVGNFKASTQHLEQFAGKKTTKDLVLERLIKGEDICTKEIKHIRKYATDFKKLGMPIERINCNELGCEHKHKHGAYYFEWAGA